MGVQLCTNHREKDWYTWLCSKSNRSVRYIPSDLDQYMVFHDNPNPWISPTPPSQIESEILRLAGKDRYLKKALIESKEKINLPQAFISECLENQNINCHKVIHTDLARMLHENHFGDALNCILEASKSGVNYLEKESSQLFSFIRENHICFSYVIDEAISLLTIFVKIKKLRNSILKKEMNFRKFRLLKVPICKPVDTLITKLKNTIIQQYHLRSYKTLVPVMAHILTPIQITTNYISAISSLNIFPHNLSAISTIDEGFNLKLLRTMKIYKNIIYSYKEKYPNFSNCLTENYFKVTQINLIHAMTNIIQIISKPLVFDILPLNSRNPANQQLEYNINFDSNLNITRYLKRINFSLLTIKASLPKNDDNLLQSNIKHFRSEISLYFDQSIMNQRLNMKSYLANLLYTNILLTDNNWSAHIARMKVFTEHLVTEMLQKLDFLSTNKVILTSNIIFNFYLKIQYNTVKWLTKKIYSDFISSFNKLLSTVTSLIFTNIENVNDIISDLANTLIKLPFTNVSLWSKKIITCIDISDDFKFPYEANEFCYSIFPKTIADRLLDTKNISMKYRTESRDWVLNLNKAISACSIAEDIFKDMLQEDFFNTHVSSSDTTICSTIIIKLIPRYAKRAIKKTKNFGLIKIREILSIITNLKFEPFNNGKWYSLLELSKHLSNNKNDLNDLQSSLNRCNSYVLKLLKSLKTRQENRFLTELNLKNSSIIKNPCTYSIITKKQSKLMIKQNKDALFSNITIPHIQNLYINNLVLNHSAIILKDQILIGNKKINTDEFSKSVIDILDLSLIYESLEINTLSKECENFLLTNIVRYCQRIMFKSNELSLISNESLDILVKYAQWINDLFILVFFYLQMNSKQQITFSDKTYNILDPYRWNYGQIDSKNQKPSVLKPKYYTKRFYTVKKNLLFSLNQKCHESQVQKSNSKFIKKRFTFFNKIREIISANENNYLDSQVHLIKRKIIIREILLTSKSIKYQSRKNHSTKTTMYNKKINLFTNTSNKSILRDSKSCEMLNSIGTSMNDLINQIISFAGYKFLQLIKAYSPTQIMIKKISLISALLWPETIPYIASNLHPEVLSYCCKQRKSTHTNGITYLNHNDKMKILLGCLKPSVYVKESVKIIVGVSRLLKKINSQIVYKEAINKVCQSFADHTSLLYQLITYNYTTSIGNFVTIIAITALKHKLQIPNDTKFNAAIKERKLKKKLATIEVSLTADLYSSHTKSHSTAVSNTRLKNINSLYSVHHHSSNKTHTYQQKSNNDKQFKMNFNSYNKKELCSSNSSADVSPNSEGIGHIKLHKKVKHNQNGYYSSLNITSSFDRSESYDIVSHSVEKQNLINSNMASPYILYSVQSNTMSENHSNNNQRSRTVPNNKKNSISSIVGKEVNNDLRSKSTECISKVTVSNHFSDFDFKKTVSNTLSNFREHFEKKSNCIITNNQYLENQSSSLSILQDLLSDKDDISNKLTLDTNNSDSHDNKNDSSNISYSDGVSTSNSSLEHDIVLKCCHNTSLEYCDEIKKDLKKEINDEFKANSSTDQELENTSDQNGNKYEIDICSNTHDMELKNTEETASILNDIKQNMSAVQYLSSNCSEYSSNGSIILTNDSYGNSSCDLYEVQSIFNTVSKQRFLESYNDLNKSNNEEDLQSIDDNEFQRDSRQKSLDQINDIKISENSRDSYLFTKAVESVDSENDEKMKTSLLENEHTKNNIIVNERSNSNSINTIFDNIQSISSNTETNPYNINPLSLAKEEIHSHENNGERTEGINIFNKPTNIYNKSTSPIDPTTQCLSDEISTLEKYMPKDQPRISYYDIPYDDSINYDVSVSLDQTNTQNLTKYKENLNYFNSIVEVVNDKKNSTHSLHSSSLNSLVDYNDTNDVDIKIIDQQNIVPKIIIDEYTKPDIESKSDSKEKNTIEVGNIQSMDFSSSISPEFQTIHFDNLVINKGAKKKVTNAHYKARMARKK